MHSAHSVRGAMQVAPPDPMQELEAAIRATDVERVRALLRNETLRAHINDALPAYGFGATPLIAATHFGSRAIIDALLDAGADVDARSHWWAGSFGVLDDDRGFADYFISRGATVTPNAAAKLGKLGMLRDMVVRDPDAVHARGGDGQTPLHVARTVEIAAFLLDHGADVDALDVDHESTPAQYLIRERPEITSYLVSRGARTDILMAAALGDIDRVRAFLDADPARIRTVVNRDWFPMRDARAGGHIYTWTLGNHKTPHTVAREFGHDEVFDLLMQRSPAELKLGLACELGDESLFRELLAKRPDLIANLSDDDRRKLPTAAEHNNLAAVRLMLSAGWPADARAHGGHTALHFAAWHGNVAMVRELLAHHAPLEILDTANNATPLGWAIHGSENGWHRARGDYAATVTALLSAGAGLPPGVAEMQTSEAVRAALDAAVRGH